MSYINLNNLEDSYKEILWNIVRDPQFYSPKSNPDINSIERKNITLLIEHDLMSQQIHSDMCYITPAGAMILLLDKNPADIRDWVSSWRKKEEARENYIRLLDLERKDYYAVKERILKTR